MERLELTSRPGVSLVEVLVAITLMAVVLSGLGGLAFTASRQTVNLTANNLRQGVMTQEVNRVTALPFDKLPSAVGCISVTTGNFPHQRCITVTNMSSTHRLVEILIRPSQPGVRPDTTVVERTLSPVGSVLSTT